MKKTFIKSIIWRIISTTITFALAYILTGDVKIGLAIGGLEFFIKFATYFIYERINIKYFKQ